MSINEDNIKIIEGGICAVSGVETAGIKQGKYGVAIILSLDSNAAAVFTSNKVVAAPVIHTKEVIKDGKLSAIVANSGNANCFTGSHGIEDCEYIVEHTSKLINIPKDQIASSSTGVIGRKMPMDIIEPLIDKVSLKLTHSAEASTDAAKAIMTTDTHPKECAVEINIEGKPVRIGGICKGSGMIAPNMGTMLAYITTDAIIDSKYINIALKNSVSKSFNMIVVDGDESTNDTAILLANGKSNVEVVSGDIINKDFQKALDYVCINLAKQMVRDGEGANKFLEVNIKGASSPTDAVSISIGNESIFEKPDSDKSVYLVKNGEILAFEGTDNLITAEKLMSSTDIVVDIDLNLSDGEATAWGCDLSYDYVKINGEYTT